MCVRVCARIKRKKWTDLENIERIGEGEERRGIGGDGEQLFQRSTVLEGNGVGEAV